MKRKRERHTHRVGQDRGRVSTHERQYIEREKNGGNDVWCRSGRYIQATHLEEHFCISERGIQVDFPRKRVHEMQELVETEIIVENVSPVFDEHGRGDEDLEMVTEMSGP